MDVIFTVWCGPVGRHRQEAVAKLLQSVGDRYGCVHNWARHCTEQQLWWGVHNLRRQSNINTIQTNHSAKYSQWLALQKQLRSGRLGDPNMTFPLIIYHETTQLEMCVCVYIYKQTHTLQYIYIY